MNCFYGFENKFYIILDDSESSKVTTIVFSTRMYKSVGAWFKLKFCLIKIFINK